MLKYLLIIPVIILFTGCYNSKSIDECKQMQFKGFTIEKESPQPQIFCTNGITVNYGDKQEIITHDGMIPVHYTTGKPYKEYTRVFISFEEGQKPFTELK